MTILKIKKLSPDVPMPKRMSSGSSGFDVFAWNDHPITVGYSQRVKIPTGICLEIPVGFEVQLRSRSGLALKNGIFLLNSPATIDSDYRGELSIILCSISKDPFTVNRGDRIAQMVLCSVPEVNLVESDELSDPGSRGTGGFGSTGV